MAVSPEQQLEQDIADTLAAAKHILSAATQEINDGIKARMRGCNSTYLSCQQLITQAISESFKDAELTYRAMGGIILGNLNSVINQVHQYVAQLGYTPTLVAGVNVPVPTGGIYYNNAQVSPGFNDPVSLQRIQQEPALVESAQGIAIREFKPSLGPQNIQSLVGQVPQPPQSTQQQSPQAEGPARTVAQLTASNLVPATVAPQPISPFIPATQSPVVVMQRAGSFTRLPVGLTVAGPGGITSQQTIAPPTISTPTPAGVCKPPPGVKTWDYSTAGGYSWPNVNYGDWVTLADGSSGIAVLPSQATPGSALLRPDMAVEVCFPTVTPTPPSPPPPIAIGPLPETPWSVANAPQPAEPTTLTGPVTTTQYVCCDPPNITVQIPESLINRATGADGSLVPVDLDKPHAWLFAPDDASWKKEAIDWEGGWLKRFSESTDLDSYLKSVYPVNDPPNTRSDD